MRDTLSDALARCQGGKHCTCEPWGRSPQLRVGWFLFFAGSGDRFFPPGSAFYTLPCAKTTPVSSSSSVGRTLTSLQHMRPDTAGGTQPGPMCRSKRFCLMHLAVAAGVLLIHLLAFMLTPAGHAMVATAWAWFKDQFHKKSGSSRTWVSIRTKKFEVIYSSQEAAVAQELVAPSTTNLLQQLPPALGGECPTPPQVSANRLPGAALAAKKRRARRRPRPQSSRRAGCEHRSASVRKGR